MQKTFLGAHRPFTQAAKWARGAALTAGLCLAAALSTPAQAEVFILPADEPYFDLREYDLGSGGGTFTVTFTSSRALDYLSAYTADFMEYHLHTDGGSSGSSFEQYVSNQVWIKTWSHGFTIRYITHPNESYDGCCWMEDGEPLNYHEDIRYTSHLWVDIQFAPGTDPIQITMTDARVPEPATWAMMIIGFGLVGNGVRRSRRDPVALVS